MKALIPMGQYGIFADAHDTARADSRFVAEFFRKEHKNVLRDIREIIAPEGGLSEEFRRLNFEQSTYKDDHGRKQHKRHLEWYAQANTGSLGTARKPVALLANAWGVGR